MFTLYEVDRRWLTAAEDAEAMGIMPGEIAEACRRGWLRWTVAVYGVPLVEPAIVSDRGL